MANLRSCAGIMFALLGTIEPLHAVSMNIPPGYSAQNLGTAALADPSGTTHTKQEVAGRVVVAIFSAPTPSQGDLQKQWSSVLAAKLPASVAFILVEDMSEAGMFRGIALGDMKKEFSPRDRPFLILDQTGDFVKRFGVPRDKTVILIYDQKGDLRDVETNLGDQAATVSRVQAIVRRLRSE